MKPYTKRAAQAIGAVVAGAAAGYVAGILNAPAKGSETRGRIRKGVEAEADDLRKTARRGLMQAKDNVTSAVTAGAKRVAAVAGRGEKKGEDAIAALNRG